MKYCFSGKADCRVRLTTADFGSACKEFRRLGIMIYDSEDLGKLTFSFRVPHRSRKALKEICEKRGDLLEISLLPGVFSSTKGILHRPILMIGIVLLLLFFLLLPTRVLFIKVIGNEQVPTERILDTLEQCGISFGCSRKRIRSNPIKNELLTYIPELLWAGVNTKGCIAEITVKEQKPPDLSDRAENFSIVAAKDGIIERCSAVSGTLNCLPGQAVRKGQVLISGYENDGKILRPVAAAGEIYGKTMETWKAVTPAQVTKRGREQSRRKVIWLVIGKNRIKIYGKSGNDQSICGRMYAEYNWKLPGGYRLPVKLTVDEYLVTALTQEPKSAAASQPQLRAFARRLVKENMIAGQILAAEERVSQQNDLIVLEGRYLCSEMIGRIRQEQIGEKQNTWNES